MLHHFSFAHEVIVLDHCCARRIEELSRRIKNSDKAFRHQVVNFLFYLRQNAFGFLAGRNNGEVITDLGIIEDLFSEHDVVILQGLLCELAEGGCLSDDAQNLFNRRKVIFRQCAGIRTRISQQFVLFVECLGNRQRCLGREAEA